MAKLIFRLRDVPDDEAQEIRELLDANNIDFYETDAGNWGISMPAIWINDDSVFETAELLIERYQQKRSNEAREAWQERKLSGTSPGIIQIITKNPIASIGLLLFCGAIIYLSTKPFLRMFDSIPTT